MRLLEDDIDTLKELDRIRRRSATLRDEGRRALRTYEATRWIRSEDSIEDALVCKALCQQSAADEADSPPALLVEKLESLKLGDLLNREDDEVPMLRAARVMQALVAAPDSALSNKTVSYCFYRIVRELYSPHSPEWVLGGARAGEGCPVSAFITSECVRAISGLSRNLNRTADFLEGIRRLRERAEPLEGFRYLSDWTRIERERLDLDFYIKLKGYSGNIALRLDASARGLTLNNLTNFADDLENQLALSLEKTSGYLGEAIDDVIKFRKREVSESSKRAIHRSNEGHDRGLGVLKEGQRLAQKALRILRKRNLSFDRKIRDIEGLFHSAGSDVARLLGPTKRFFSAVLDRELAATSSELNLRWSPSEMTFAATSYGRLFEFWNDDRLLRAVRYLSASLSDRGRFPAGRPILANEKGYALHVAGAETLRAFSQLLQYVEGFELTPELARSILAFFEDTRTPPASTEALDAANAQSGWFPEDATKVTRPYLWVSALATLALDRLTRMLDQNINRRIFQHFSVRPSSERRELGQRKVSTNLTLDRLFFPDHGLQKMPGEIEQELRLSLALERMRAHVVNVSPLHPGWEPLFSVVLYGPGGTGKTTLVEALAASCDVPLVEVTPSDIVVGGSEAIERRTRAVFDALSLLTEAVILFDEFESVLWWRDPNERRTVLSFLTPGMLPKLKKLHDNAKRQRVAYALVTNQIGCLDYEAIRKGRFDAKIGVYPADPISRTGRLVAEIVEFKLRRSRKSKVDVDKRRLLEVLQETGSALMEELSRPGFFSRPREGEEPAGGTPFSHVLKGRKLRMKLEKLPSSEEIKVTGTGHRAKREFQQRKWLWEWEQRLQKAESIEDALEAYPTEIPEIPPSEEDRKKKARGPRGLSEEEFAEEVGGLRGL